MKMRPIRWGHFAIGIVILTIILLLAIYTPTPPTSMRFGRSGISLGALVSIFGEFAGRYYFFLLPFYAGFMYCVVSHGAFRDPRNRAGKP